jgi:hypothetical protein
MSLQPYFPQKTLLGGNNLMGLEDVFSKFGINEIESKIILEKAVAGGEISSNCSPAEWLKDRFIPNIVLISEDGYTHMCVDALKILGRTAATDYGGSRQRDLGQLWADMTRGYLGELAFKLYMKKKWDIECQLGHEIGELKDFLPGDIPQIKEKGGTYRTPKINISVKTTKWNGIWLDIPGDQFNHSDIHVLVKVGTGRDHLFAFFKAISVFKDKVLQRGKDVGCLSDKEAEVLFEKLPSFKPIPAYICGFVKKNSEYESLAYSGKKGRLNYTISSWKGPISSGDLELIKKRENVTGKVSFEGIGSFAHESGYLFNTGSLSWRNEDWLDVIGAL